MEATLARFFTLAIILLVMSSLSYPMVVAAGSSLTIYSHNVLEVPVEVEGFFKGFLKMFNETISTYLEGSLSRNHTFEGSVDLKFRKVVEDNILKSNLTLDAEIANVSSRDLNFTLNVRVYCEAYKAEGSIVSRAIIEANYTDWGKLAKTLKLKSLRVEALFNVMLSSSKELLNLTVEGLIKPRSGIPQVDKLLTLIIANIINETLKEVKAILEKTPDVTFEYKVGMDADKGQVYITISLISKRELPGEISSIILKTLEKEGVINLKLKPGIIEFKTNITAKFKKPLKGYFETSLEIGGSKLRVSLLVNKTLGENHGLETAKILENIIQAASTITAFQEQLTILTTTTQEILKGMERALAKLEKELPTQYQVLIPTTTPNQTTTMTTTELEIPETLKTPEREERETNIPLIMILIITFTLAVIAIAYRLLTRKISPST